MTTRGTPAVRRIRAQGHAVSYMDMGEGETVVLLHGSGPGASARANWTGTMTSLVEAGFRVVAPDVLGFGDSDKPEEFRYDAVGWAGHIKAFLEALGLARAHIVGNSMGGRIGLTVTSMHPESVLSLTTMGVRGPGASTTPGLTTVREYVPSLENMEKLLTRSFLYDPSLIQAEHIRMRYEASIAPGAMEAYRRMFSTPGANDLPLSEGDLKQLSVPVLVVHGREDAVIPVECAYQLGKMIPDTMVVVMSRCGHWVQVDRATEFEELVTLFLRRHHA